VLFTFECVAHIFDDLLCQVSRFFLLSVLFIPLMALMYRDQGSIIVWHNSQFIVYETELYTYKIFILVFQLNLNCMMVEGLKHKGVFIEFCYILCLLA
jgi:hypothetical protein